MRPLFFIPVAIFLLTISSRSLAQGTKIAGGQISYKHLLYNKDSKLHKYEINLRLVQSCPNDTLPEKVSLVVFKKGSYNTPIYRINDLPRETLRRVTPTEFDQCIDVYPDVCFFAATYRAFIFIQDMEEDAEIFFAESVREKNIVNIIDGQGAGFMATFPGKARDSSAMNNSSPDFFRNEAVLTCANSPINFNMSARDPDGDSLVYYFCSGLSENLPSTPLFYRPKLSGGIPMGIQVTIDPVSGVITGKTPSPGKYLVAVCVSEYRRGKLLCTNRKEIIINVGNCNLARAELPEKMMGCREFTVRFSNAVNFPMIKTYRWDFGIPGVLSDTSNESNPSFTYPDTGVFRARLIINEGLSCDDTAYTDVYVYPRMNADFRLKSDCIFPFSPVEFEDLTTTSLGQIVRWSWDLGQPGQYGNELSPEQNPIHYYRSARDFPIELTVYTNYGCSDTVRKTIRIFSKELLQVNNDTSLCIGDTIQLTAKGPEPISWSPSYRIINNNTPNPWVYPDRDTTYTAELSLLPGCILRKSVSVLAKRFIEVDAGNDTTICLSDTISLHAQSDGLRFRWSPSQTINDPAAKDPLVVPTEPINLYKVVANTGNCVATDSVKVYTVPYPSPTTNNDTFVCFKQSVSLIASGGDRYSWTPAAGLSNPNSSATLASPSKTTNYRVAVWANTGCPKPGYADVLVTVIPEVKAFAGNDTSIIAGQPLQLQASGGEKYQWTPATGLNRSNIQNPIATISENTNYKVIVSTDEGCSSTDEIKVKVFKSDVGIFVPNAFTPNKDGLNDTFKPTPVGIKRFDYFRIYNRWGQLIFQTSIPTQGWEGLINGKGAAAGTYVWEARGIDYLGKVVLKRSSFVLVR